MKQQKISTTLIKIISIILLLAMLSILISFTAVAMLSRSINPTFTIKFYASREVQIEEVSGEVYVGSSEIVINSDNTVNRGDKIDNTITYDDSSSTFTISNINLTRTVNTTVIVVSFKNVQTYTNNEYLPYINYLAVTPHAEGDILPQIYAANYYNSGNLFTDTVENDHAIACRLGINSIAFKYANVGSNYSDLNISIDICPYYEADSTLLEDIVVPKYFGSLNPICYAGANNIEINNAVASHNDTVDYYQFSPQISNGNIIENACTITETQIDKHYNIELVFDPTKLPNDCNKVAIFLEVRYDIIVHFCNSSGLVGIYDEGYTLEQRYFPINYQDSECNSILYDNCSTPLIIVFDNINQSSTNLYASFDIYPSTSKELSDVLYSTIIEIEP